MLSFNVVAPLIVYMAIGYLLRRFRVVEERAFTQISQIVFYAAIPALCFQNIRVLDFQSVFSNSIALQMAAAIVIVFTIIILVVPRFCKENARRGVLIQGLFRTNDGVFGLAVAETLLGAANIGIMVVCIAVTIPLYNMLGVAEMEYFRGGKPNIGKILVRLIKNPIILGCLAGLVFGVFQWRVPQFLDKPLSGIAGICAPLGFMALGGALSFDSLADNRKALGWVCAMKLVLIPAAVLTAFYLMGMRGDPLLVALIIFGGPTAMSVYPMACSMNGDAKLAGGIVALTSTLSLLTIFGFIFLLKQTGVA